MMDAIQRARAERRLAVKLAAALLVVVALLYGLLVRATARPAEPSHEESAAVEVAE